MEQLKGCIYARFSSDMQREESIDAQVRACKEFAEHNSIDIVKIYADKAVSAKTDKRPEFQKMIKDSANYDVVLVHKYNRFARRMIDHLIYEDKLTKNSCDLIAVVENFGSGKESIITKAVIRAMSEYYIADLSDEVRKGHKENALKALHNGGYAPFGYDIVDGNHVINEFEAQFVRKMFDCAYRKIGYKDLIEEMAAAGVKGKRGKQIKYPSIYEILHNEKYTGTYVYDTESSKTDRRAKKNAIRIDDAIPQIIPREIWEKVQEYMDKRKISGKTTDYLCKGMVYCECGNKMTGHIAKKRKESPYFYCNKRCGVGSIKMEIVDNACRKYTDELLSKQTMEQLGHHIAKFQTQSRSEIKLFNASVDKKIEEKKMQVDGLLEKMALPHLDELVIGEISNKIVSLKREVDALQKQEPPKTFDYNQIKHWILSIKEGLNSSNISNVIERITITKEKEVKITSTLTSLTGISPQIGGDTQI
ncbi:MAG: recombinase family protein [Anaerovoracaceae bacterium]